MDLNQPQDDDMDLGGIEGVKKRLASDFIEQKVAALSEAFNYGQAGLDLVIEVLKDPSSPIQSVAYLLLKERAEQQVKEALQQYYGESIKSHELYQKFVISATYELRTPINGMIGFLKLIMEGMADNPEEERDFLEEAHKLALNLCKRINDILDITTIEANKMDLNLGEVKLDKLFKDVENFAQPLVQRKHLSLSLQMPTNFDEIILYSNYQRLLEVMLNLVDNAIKFTDEGGITISVEVIKKKVYFDSREFSNMVKIKVADTGIGLSFYEQRKLFQPFGKLKSSEGQNVSPGICLGLALSKRFVQLMGGEMNFFSAGENMGSTVTFTIPMSFSA